MVADPFAEGSGAVRALVLQPNGRLVAGGVGGAQAGPGGFAVARYRPDGTLDPSFGQGGKVTTGFSGEGSAAIRALARQADGKLVAAGEEGVGSASGAHFALARYLLG